MAIVYSCRLCRENRHEAMFQYMPRCWGHYACWLKDKSKGFTKSKDWRPKLIALLRTVPTKLLKKEFPIIVLTRWLNKVGYSNNVSQFRPDAEKILKEACRHRKCKYCKKEKPDVQLRPDGFEREVHNRDGAMHTACDACNVETDRDI